METIYRNMNFENIKTSVEPFCGSCAMSYYVWLKHPKLTFVLNDNNKYLKEIYDIIKNDKKLEKFEIEFNEFKDNMKNDENSKEEYVKAVNHKNPKTLMGWLMGMKYYSRRCCLYPSTNLKVFDKNMKFKDYPIYEFFKNQILNLLILMLLKHLMPIKMIQIQ